MSRRLLNGSTQMGKHQKRTEWLAGCHWRLARQCFHGTDRARADPASPRLRRAGKLPVAPAFPFVWSYLVRLRRVRKPHELLWRYR